MKKAMRFVSLMLASVLTLSMMCGCGEAKTATTWKIGGIGPITGDNAAYGLGVKNAIELAVNEINADGGIGGIQIDYRFEDDITDNEKSVNAYNTLKDWGMNLLVGSTTSGCSIAVADKSVADNMFQLTPSASAADVVKNDNVFQVCFTDPNQGIGSARYIGENNMAEKVAVIYNSSDVYSSGIYETFMKESDNQSYDVVVKAAFTDDSKSDFTVQLQQAKDAGASVVFIPVYYQEASLILTQAAAMDYSPVFFGCDGLDGIVTKVEGFDTSLAEGTILLTPFAADGTDDKTVKFVNAYKEKYGDLPNQFAADAYDAVYILKALIEKSNATPADGISGICEKLKAEIVNLTFDGLTGEGMTWAVTGEVNKAPRAMKIVNGNYALIQ